MIRDITIGQYYPAKSILHRLDPRVKVVSTLLFLISLFLFRSIPGYIIATAFLVMVVRLSKVPFGYIVKGLKPIIMILMLTVLFQLFLTRGGDTLVHWWIFTIIEKLLGPLNKIHIPVHEIAMTMSIALRFIPILLEETDKIMKAQIARGADFESGNMLQRAKAMIPILVPLFVSAFRHANDLAMAMEARCYHGGEGRTKMKPLRYVSRDHVAYAIVILYVAAVFVIGRYVPFHIWIF